MTPELMEEGVEKDSHMTSVEFHSADGRRALLAFSGSDSLEAWDESARPIPRVAFTVAQSVLEQGLDALIIDVGGPVPTAIDGTLLSLLAIGPNREALLDDTLDEVVAQLAQLPGVSSAHWDDTDEEVTIILAISEPIATLGTAITEVIAGSQVTRRANRGDRNTDQRKQPEEKCHRQQDLVVHPQRVFAVVGILVLEGHALERVVLVRGRHALALGRSHGRVGAGRRIGSRSRLDSGRSFCSRSRRFNRSGRRRILRRDAHRRERREPGSHRCQNSFFHTGVPLTHYMCPSGSNLIPYRPLLGPSRPAADGVRLALGPASTLPLAALAECLKRF